ncbi:MAG: phage integrase SAM-like domain-containing protein [Bacteroidales bacterium]
MRIKCKVNFYPEKRKNSFGRLTTENVPVFLFFSYSGMRMVYYTGYRIDIDKWDPVSQRVKRNNFNRDGISATIINGHLDQLQTTITEIYTEQKAIRKTPSIQYIRNELKNRMGEQKTTSSFFERFSSFIESESLAQTWTAGTVTKFWTNYNHLQDFEKKKHFKIDFDNIDDTFFNKYVTFQRDDLLHRNTTIAKNLKIFKWFMNWATRKGYNRNLAYKDYNPELKGTTRSQKIIFLTWEELMHLNTLKVKKNYLDQVRDVFCFCCFTGLRYSDVYNLKHSNIKEDSIQLVTIKTEDPLTIDLNQYSRSILDKYKDIPFKDDKCLPVISNQKFNDYLKELGQEAKFNKPETIVYYKGNERKENTFQKWQLLSTHVGRKTFVSNALYFNIPAEVIMSWTGQKSHEVMENYYKIQGKQKRREMDKFNTQNNEKEIEGTIE